MAPEFSAALCRGLIEAEAGYPRACPPAPGFPRLYVAASLKPQQGQRVSDLPIWFSAALCRGLIEAAAGHGAIEPAGPGFPRLYVAASLKRGWSRAGRRPQRRFPRLYVAASLKLDHPCNRHRDHRRRFPRLYVAASLKLGRVREELDKEERVFRGFMSRPH